MKTPYSKMLVVRYSTGVSRRPESHRSRDQILVENVSEGPNAPRPMPLKKAFSTGCFSRRISPQPRAYCRMSGLRARKELCAILEQDISCEHGVLPPICWPGGAERWYRTGDNKGGESPVFLGFQEAGQESLSRSHLLLRLPGRHRHKTSSRFLASGRAPEYDDVA